MIISRILVTLAVSYGVQKAAEVVAEKAVDTYFKLGGIEGIKNKLIEFKDSFDSSKNADLLYEDIKLEIDFIATKQKEEGREWSEDEIKNHIEKNIKKRYINDLDQVLLNIRINTYCIIRFGTVFA